MKKYKFLFAISVIAIGLMTVLLASINEKKEEKESLLSVPKIEKWETKNEEFRKFYPREFDSWKQTKNSDQIDDMLKLHPEMVVLWAGYAFSKDYNAPRGHFYAIDDVSNSLRTGAPTDKESGPLPSACWTCKSPDVPRIMHEQGNNEYFTGKWAKYGADIVNPIGCIDCHNPETMELQVGRSYLNDALKAEGKSPTLATATQQDMRTLVCAQCHVEYYFKKTPLENGKTAMAVTLPWANGTTVEDMEKYYDTIEFSDWVHQVSKTPMIKAQHPEYETWKTGAHGRNNVSCADCHMPYTQEGGIKYTDHKIGNPLENMDKTCMNCHRVSEKSLLANIQDKKARKDDLNQKAMEQIVAAHLEAGKAWEVGATPEEMKDILTDIRHAQWRWDFAAASHGAFFHAPEETLKTLGTAIEKAGNARIKLAKVLAKHGVTDYKAPTITDKKQAQELIGLPMGKLIEEKKQFTNGLLKDWKNEAEQKGLYNPKSREGVETKTSY
ncbi:ammonia-forming cytochrome c nitrite reductase [Aliarcobacter butzleri]|uniref:ammonia-forming cytochrome c nitrite reductase n=1 Tax=Aliarcobacter butzleri TaxID=28197 RepID=UPI001EE0C440|nr:ammonia-forming cytochrome c nitrite reductase [Aliarcobacter butzleri]MCG3696176.1 ammonia-forming cytochrome c nitrite reductase [Aliarcobacter butzleri]MCG3698294.1 ammonia-forming cytochrome c nitrite reductase [Aliarcobacter butzleri]MCT7616124.1 ammonia-forming cytochrome c nitrite reductase [Aliarcobacter butzleri]MDN5079247.1 ammonia-forming cytochrome c nitrite reductase [Aliarcobacter butzleri]MDN5090513.1 ammonia-forming cytochrome c nitrite reductase [Aliarcobacter butzleri]